jgi:transglutaminase-like putative cysteine protease
MKLARHYRKPAAPSSRWGYRLFGVDHAGTNCAASNGVRFVAFAALSTLVSAVSLAQSTALDLAALGAYASDADSQPIVPKLGESFYTTVQFRVSGNLKGSYIVRIETPYKRIETQPLTFGQGSPGDYFVTWGPIPVVTDRSIRVKATLVPLRGVRESNSANNTAAFDLSPEKPFQAIEYFGHKTLHGTIASQLVWRSGQQPGQVTAWLPVPATESFQSVSAANLPAAFAFRGPEGFTSLAPSVAMLEAPNNQLSFQFTMQTSAASQRVNSTMLRLVGMDELAYLPENLRDWTQPETLVQSSHPSIVAAAAKISGDGTVYGTAESIYLSLLKMASYWAKPGITPSALDTLKRKKGDCGGLSALFVALCRAKGIPARTVSGFTKGTNRWHVWAEFFVPQHGWVAADPAYAEGLGAKGDLPLYFGVVPDLNERIATSFGFQKEWNGQSVPYLQAPTFFWSNPRARLTTAQVSCSLTPAP